MRRGRKRIHRAQRKGRRNRVFVGYVIAGKNNDGIGVFHRNRTSSGRRRSRRRVSSRRFYSLRRLNLVVLGDGIFLHADANRVRINIIGSNCGSQSKDRHSNNRNDGAANDQRDNRATRQGMCRLLCQQSSNDQRSVLTYTTRRRQRMNASRACEKPRYCTR